MEGKLVEEVEVLGDVKSAKVDGRILLEERLKLGVNVVTHGASLGDCGNEPETFGSLLDKVLRGDLFEAIHLSSVECIDVWLRL